MTGINKTVTTSPVRSTSGDRVPRRSCGASATSSGGNRSLAGASHTGVRWWGSLIRHVESSPRLQATSFSFPFYFHTLYSRYIESIVNV